MMSLSMSWWLILMFAGPAALLIGMRVVRRAFPRMPAISQRQRWELEGRCHACGYNLKGVESYMCPECGIVRLYSARQWKAKVAADAAKLAQLKQKEQESV